jgi:phage-related protein
MEGGRPVYPRSEIMARKPVVWLGDSLHAVRGFAAEGRRRAGQELGLVQAGTTARLDVELARQRYRTLIRDRKQ